jgi:hypothetical protein
MASGSSNRRQVRFRFPPKAAKQRRLLSSSSAVTPSNFSRFISRINECTGRATGRAPGLCTLSNTVGQAQVDRKRNFSSQCIVNSRVHCRPARIGRPARISFNLKIDTAQTARIAHPGPIPTSTLIINDEEAIWFQAPEQFFLRCL